MIVPVILAGGSGSRLWPLSRQLYPKQLIDLHTPHTMLQDTLLRLDGLKDMASPIIICNEEHRFMTAEQVRQIQKNPQAIILEPEGKNTAPAIALGAVKLLDQDQDAVMLVLPADHVIGNIHNFHQTILNAHNLAAQGMLVTFGIVPDSAQTGYGYIRKGKPVSSDIPSFYIDRFVEKPDSETAQNYLDSDEYLWNSGMFMFRASVIVQQLECYCPQMISLCRQAVETGEQDLDFFRINPEAFALVPSDSIDYAVMEKTEKGVVVPLDAGWNDLGSFDALWQTGKRDEKGNVVKGDVLLYRVKDSFVHAGSRLVAAAGVENFVIVETPDAVLVCPRDQVQDIKTIVQKLKDQGRAEPVFHSRVYRPWGDYETIDAAARYQVKRITVKPGAKLSLQKHYHRAEHWTVVSGSALVTCGDTVTLLKEDESAYIPVGTLHRLENPGKIPLELIEVQSGPYLGEDDIVRLDDVYGRKKKS